MLAMLKQLRALWRDDEGATATEYAVMIALVILVCIGAVSALGDKVSQIFADASVGW
jgi:pilus assembly protein Flp/PilA